MNDPASRGNYRVKMHADQGSLFPGTAGVTIAFDYWAGASADACAVVEPAVKLCDAQGPTTVLRKRATGCRNGTEVLLYRLAGGAHEWPLRPMNVPGAPTQ